MLDQYFWKMKIKRLMTLVIYRNIRPGKWHGVRGKVRAIMPHTTVFMTIAHKMAYRLCIPFFNIPVWYLGLGPNDFCALFCLHDKPDTYIDKLE